MKIEMKKPGQNFCFHHLNDDDFFLILILFDLDNYLYHTHIDIFEKWQCVCDVIHGNRIKKMSPEKSDEIYFHKH